MSHNAGLMKRARAIPFECVFTRGFVRQYNAALGYDDAYVDADHSDAVAPLLAPALAKRPGNLKPLTPGYATQASVSATSSPTLSTTQNSAGSGEAR